MSFHQQLDRALDTFSGRHREDVARQVRVVGDELAAVARADATSRDGGTTTGRLVEGIRALDGARSLSDILDTRCRAGVRATEVRLKPDTTSSWSKVRLKPDTTYS